MGNHDVGRAFAALAEGYWLACGDEVPTKAEALQALDAAGNRYLGADAEFDDELNEVPPLSRLVAIAFDATPEEMASLRGELDTETEDDAGMHWYEGPERRFRDRYKFC